MRTVCVSLFGKPLEELPVEYRPKLLEFVALELIDPQVKTTCPLLTK